MQSGTRIFLRWLGWMLVAASVCAAQSPESLPVLVGASGQLRYRPDSRGNRITDFSYAGYMGGGIPLPSVVVKRRAKPSGSDDTAAIQAALDAVSRLPLKSRFRGAVLLEPGTFHCSHTLRISASGVVLRGSGSSASMLQLNGDPHVAVSIEGDATETNVGAPTHIEDSYVPSGALSINVESAVGLHQGERVRITRPVTAEWLRFMGMDDLVRNGKHETWVGDSITTQRIVTRIAKNTLYLDVPLVDSYDRKYLPPDGAEVQGMTTAGEIEQSGVEHLRIVAPVRHVSLTQQLFGAIRMRDLQDGWVRDVRVEDTTGGVSAGEGTRRITVEDVDIRHSTSIEGAAKPADFSVNGTQVLFLRCSSTGDNLFYVVTGARNQGPNVVLDSEFRGDGHLEPHQRWSTGLLVDNTKVPDGGIDFINRGEMGSGHGWTMAWGVVWNSLAKTFVIQNPPGAINWSIGNTGEELTESMPTFPKSPLPDLPQGEILSSNRPVLPQSLYKAQLKERLGNKALRALGPHATP
jgi:hypothetical protein